MIKLRLKRGTKIFLGLLLVLVLAYAGYMTWAVSRVTSELERIREAGLPITSAELAAYYPAPVGENAATLYERAHEAYIEDDELMERIPTYGWAAQWPLRGEPVDPDAAEAVAAFLALNEQSLALYVQAAAIERCKFTVEVAPDYTQTYLPQLMNARVGARLLQARAYHAVVRDDAALAGDTLVSMMGLSRALDEDPLLLSRLVTLSLDECAYESTEIVVNYLDLSPAHITELRHRIQPNFDAGEAARKAMIGERVYGYEHYDADVGDNLHRIRPLTKTLGLYYIDLYHYLRVTGDIVEALPDLQQASEIADPLVETVPAYCVVAQNFVAFGSWLRTELGYETKALVTDAGLAVLQYRADHGALPNALGDLVPKYLPEVSTDPFDPDDAPLRYRRTDDGFVVYSVWGDGVDNQGRHFNDEGIETGDGIDYAFVYGKVFNEQMRTIDAEQARLREEEGYRYGYGDGTYEIIEESLD